jgi:CBS domain-containing protein
MAKALTVGDAMTRNPVSLGPEDTLAAATTSMPLLDAVETLHTSKYGALPVVDGDTVVGILTDSDLIRTLRDLLKAE